MRAPSSLESDHSAAGAPVWSRARLIALLLLTALPVLLTTLILRAAAALHVDLPLTSPYREFLVYAVANWITFALVVPVAGWEALRVHGLRFPLTMRRFVAACAAFVAGLAVYMGVSWWLRRVGLPPVRGMQFTGATTIETAAMFASVVVTAAFCEEVFFRVIWIGGLRRMAPTWLVGLVSIVAFAVIHYPYFGIGGVIFISAWALLPVWLFIRFGDLTAPIAMHMMNNAFAYLLVPLLTSPPS